MNISIKYSGKNLQNLINNTKFNKLIKFFMLAYITVKIAIEVAYLYLAVKKCL